MKFVSSFLMCMLLLALLGCRSEPVVSYTGTWHDLILELEDTDRIARLDTLSARMVSSSDPTGGNNDFNQYIRKGPEGWWVIAELDGPGYISRFWFTGGDSRHRVRFYFDGEAEPRIDMSIGAFCGGSNPFLPPLAVNENNCWYNLIPIPYEQSVVIMVEEGGNKPGNWPRLFYQVNYHRLSRGERIPSFPREISSEDRSVIAGVRNAWREGSIHDLPEDTVSDAITLKVEAGDASVHALTDGPAILRRLYITPDYAALPDARSREALLRDVILNVYWEEQEHPSISVPLGDFFGAFWRRNRFDTMYLGTKGDTFFSRFPKPYERGARIELVNQGPHAVSFEVETVIEPRPVFPGVWGYFHAGWMRTTPDDFGHPHRALSIRGTGKYVGCMLSVVSADRSWWILEADESIRVDHERMPGWRGTGLEDYFNGGWYYQNAIISPLAGIPFLMPFRVLQYRFHLMDPVHFSDSIDVEFERGPQQDSRGWMESVAYYYMDRAVKAASELLTPVERRPPDDGLGYVTVMTEINNMERIGDYQGAYDYIEYFLERFDDFPPEFQEVLRLRLIAYRERKQGFDAVRDAYLAFQETAESDIAREQVANLLWFHEDPSHALLSAFCNMPTAVFLNGQAVGGVQSPEVMTVFRVQVKPGENVLALQSRHKPYPDWVQSYLRTHHGDVYTTPSWRWRFAPRGAWTSPGFEDAGWSRLGSIGTKGPPEIPHVWVVPHAYVDMQSIAVGLRPTQEWRNPSDLVGYRLKFDIPSF